MAGAVPQGQHPLQCSQGCSTLGAELAWAEQPARLFLGRPPRGSPLGGIQHTFKQLVGTQGTSKHVLDSPHGMEGMRSAPLKKRQSQNQPSLLPLSCLLIPLDSRLEDSPVTPRGVQGASSVDSDGSGGYPSQSSYKGSSSSEEEPHEPVPPSPSETVDSSLNFRMGSGSTQVMVDYNKPSTLSPMTTSTCTLPMKLFKKLLEGDKAATLECLALAGYDKQIPPTHMPSSTPMTLEYTLSQLESARTNLDVFSKHVREYIAEQDEWVECVQPPSQSALP